MSTKQQSSLNYDPQSMSAYHSMLPAIQSNLLQYMKNPLQSTFFNQNVGMGQQYLAGQNTTAMRNMLMNAKTSGWGAGASSPFMQSMIASQGRANAGANANNFLQNLNMSRQAQMWATGQAQQFNPLMTGQTTTTSGTGTWLPQLAGAAIGGATSALTGGLMKGAGGLSGLTSATNSLPIGNSGAFGSIAALGNPAVGMGGMFSNPFMAMNMMGGPH